MRPSIGRLAILGVAAIVQVAVVVLAHDLVYLARYGSRFNEALVHAGHGDGWKAAATTSLLLGGLASMIAVARLVRLQRDVRREHATGRLDPGAFVRTWLKIGPALALSTVALLTIQENLEQSALHGASAGLAILLTPEYAGGLWIALAVGLAIGLVVALVAWRFQTLIARLRAARQSTARTRATTAKRPSVAVDRPTTSILGRRSALRAPPVAAPVA
jgi:hypothetical protein